MFYPNLFGKDWIEGRIAVLSDSNMQTPSPRFRSQQFSKARYADKCFTQIYRDLYGDATLKPIQMGSNMAAGTQKKYICHWVLLQKREFIFRGTQEY